MLYRCLHRCITSVCVYIHSDTWMYRFLCMYAHIWMVGCSYLVLFLCGVVWWDVWGWGRHRRARRMWKRRRITDWPRCTLHRKMATTRSPSYWWYVTRGEEGGNVRICRTRRGCGGGRMSAIDIHLHRHLYGYMGLFLPIFRYCILLFSTVMFFSHSVYILI